ncbi:MAG: ice-binding family protein [Lacunisphaera sp.]|nr:ice-binding family protein [Lacunisphaera sp.]
MKLKFTSLLAGTVIAALFGTASIAQATPWHKPSVDSTPTFAVLAGSAATLTNAIVIGDVGVDHGPLTQTTSVITGAVHVGDPVAHAAYADFLADYAAIALLPCDQVISGNLAGQFLTPGVYCVDAASTTTGGVLTLVGSATDTWIFKIGTSGTGALTGTNFTVVLSSGETCNNNVIWWTAEAATLTDSVFIGSILAGADITVTRGSVDGQLLAKGAVTVTGALINDCGVVTVTPKPKANEGVGNGVDGNTPGHLHNGGNDDPAFTPGNPGAKHK